MLNRPRRESLGLAMLLGRDHSIRETTGMDQYKEPSPGAASGRALTAKKNDRPVRNTAPIKTQKSYQCERCDEISEHEPLKVRNGYIGDQETCPYCTSNLLIRLKNAEKRQTISTGMTYRQLMESQGWTFTPDSVS